MCRSCSVTRETCWINVSSNKLNLENILALKKKLPFCLMVKMMYWITYCFGFIGDTIVFKFSFCGKITINNLWNFSSECVNFCWWMWRWVDDKGKEYISSRKTVYFFHDVTHFGENVPQCMQNLKYCFHYGRLILQILHPSAQFRYCVFGIYDKFSMISDN